MGRLVMRIAPYVPQDKRGRPRFALKAMCASISWGNGSACRTRRLNRMDFLDSDGRSVARRAARLQDWCVALPDSGLLCGFVACSRNQGCRADLHIGQRYRARPWIDAACVHGGGRGADRCCEVNQECIGRCATRGCVNVEYIPSTSHKRRALLHARPQTQAAYRSHSCC